MMMTTPGGQFPVITPHGEILWWVIPEGLTGQAFSLVTGRFAKYTTVSAGTRPPSAVAGPFSTQAEAQARASQMTSQAIPGPATPQAAAGDVLTASGINVGSWLLRIGEVLLGLVLLAVGVARITRAVPVATKIAKTAGAGALLA
jgi:hypothetical protein